VSDQGTPLISSYLQVTGRLFPIVQVGKLRHRGLLGHGEEEKVAVGLSWGCTITAKP